MMSNSVQHALYSVSQIRAIEQAALVEMVPGTLMRRAGIAAAELARSLLPRMGAPILILAGPGNNGGDALETATCLREAGYQPLVLDYAGAQRSSEHSAALAHAQQAGVAFAPTPSGASVHTHAWALVIDGLFGIGLSRPIDGEFKTIIDHVNQLHCLRLALDSPSGLNADTGCVIRRTIAAPIDTNPGSQGCAFQATHTLTFIGDKPGLHTADGRDLAGCVKVASLDIEPALFPDIQLRLNEPALFADCLQVRKQNSHKGSYGDVAIIGGATGMVGAAILSARAALYGGAGRIFIGFAGDAPAFDSVHPELMCRHAQDLDFNAAVLVVGPGLGQSQTAQDLLTQALASSATLVLDADALNLLAAHPHLQQQLQQRRGATLLTPHPLEAARLLGISSAAIQADRLQAAHTLAQRTAATVVLKGSGSIIANADGALAINPTGNPALATAGTGDVLAGLCGALLAQGWPLPEAALGAVWLHGRAADQLVTAGVGPIGLCATELIPALRSVLNQAVNEYGTNDQPS